MKETQKTHPLVLLLALLLVTAASTLMLLKLAYPDNFREYWLYLSENRKPMDFRFEDLSETWTEGDLRKQFPSEKVECFAGAPQGLGDRGCYVDIASHNGAPAMLASFFFHRGLLQSATISIPWWAHKKGFMSIRSLYGRPTGFQAQAIEGVRLIGWKLENGSSLFFNVDAERHPVRWNLIFWSSARLCAKSACFVEGKVDEPH